MKRKARLGLFLGVMGVAGCGGGAITSPTGASSSITAVTVACVPTSIQPGQTSQCSASVAGTGNFSSAVTWSAASGTITSSGLYTAPSTAPGSGAANITATSTQDPTKSGAAAISISESGTTSAVTKVAVSVLPSSITTAQTAQCTATVTGTGSYSSAVTWTATGGTITQAGVFTPSGAGTGTCTAASAQTGYTNISGSASITVTSVAATITAVKVSAAPTSITTAQTAQCSATVSGTGSYNSAVTWTATGGTITQGGVFTPSAAGTGTCTANSVAAGYTNISGTANIAITAAAPTITSVTLVCSPTSITTAQTATCTPTVTGTGAFTNTVNLALSPSGGGTLSAASGVSAGTAVTFTPPSSAETATITATSTQDSTKAASTTVAVTLATAGPACSSMSLGIGASLGGFVPFPSTAAWNIDISGAAIDPNNATITSSGEWTGHHLHHDWSSVAGGNYGIPYMVVDSSATALVPVTVTDYASESDVADAPLPLTAPIEGTPANCSSSAGDQHLLVLDRNACMLYETWNTELCNGSFSAKSETIWDMENYEQRPWGWTSADAAGLPVFAGLVRYDEVASGAINHALRFTMQNTKSDSNGGYFVQPASHAAGNSSSSVMVPGMRIRLKASFNVSGFSAANQVILTAMKKYGMILADNGSSFYFQGAPDSRWNDNDLGNLDAISSSNFEVVQMTPAYPGYDAATAPKGAAPTINSFTASSSTVTAGTAVTLTWSTTNDSYDSIDKLGGVRGPSVTVMPLATTTYTLSATNQYGRSTKQVTVVAQ